LASHRARADTAGWLAGWLAATVCVCRGGAAAAAVGGGAAARGGGGGGQWELRAEGDTVGAEEDDGAAGLKLTTSQAVVFGDVWENQRKRLGVFGSKDYRCVAIGSPCLGGCSHCDPI
jgi:hypothetical protein